MADKKNLLRRYLLDKRKRLPAGLAEAYGGSIVSNIVSMPEYIEADKIYMYAPVRNEADIMALADISINMGKETLFPKVLGEAAKENMEFFRIYDVKELSPGYMGIPEPDGKDTDITDTKPCVSQSGSRGCAQNEYIKGAAKSFMIVPGAAFDVYGGRIGMGRGYYDIYLANHKIDILCGVCAEYQLLGRNGCKREAIPTDGHDVYMDYVVTEAGIYDCRLYKQHIDR